MKPSKEAIKKWEKEFDNQFADFYDIREPDELNPDAGSETLHYKDLKAFISSLLQQQREEISEKIQKHLAVDLDTFGQSGINGYWISEIVWNKLKKELQNLNNKKV